MTKKMRSFVGFSTANTAETGVWTLYDDDLIVQDILNHFHTRIGERVMRSNEGCAIWDRLMEPMNEANRQFIRDEATRICESERRVAVESVRLIEYENGLRVEISLLNRHTGDPMQMAVEFDVREAARSAGELN